MEQLNETSNENIVKFTLNIIFNENCYVYILVIKLQI